MKHLSPAQMIEAAERVLPAGPASAHLASCGVCRAEVAALIAVCEDLRAVPAPDPSPLFWEHLAARVSETIAADTRPVGTRWWRWPVLIPAGALAMAIAALTVSLVKPVSDARDAMSVALDVIANGDGAAADPVLEDSWALMSDLVSALDDEAAFEAGLSPLPGAAEQVTLTLSAEERAELVRLLRQEIGQPGG